MWAVENESEHFEVCQMNSITQQLNQFGWDEWFNVKAQEMCLVEHRLARVVAVTDDI